MRRGSQRHNIPDGVKTKLPLAEQLGAKQNDPKEASKFRQWRRTVKAIKEGTSYSFSQSSSGHCLSSNKSSHCKTLGLTFTLAHWLRRSFPLETYCIIQSTVSLLDWSPLKFWQDGSFSSSMKRIELVLTLLFLNIFWHITD